jgi:NADPH2:quinone reductase
MQAAFLVKYGDSASAFELRETKIPEPGPDEVRIKTEVFGLNFAEVAARRGYYREAPDLPFIPGYDIVGRIDKVGSQVDQNMVGKRVSALTRFGAYAEFCITKQLGVVEIPEDLDAAKAVAIGVQYCTAYYASCVLMNLFPKDKVLVHSGAGGVGGALIQFCKWKGATVYSTAGTDEKCQRASELGADHVINYLDKDYLEVIRKQLDSERLDATFNAIGGSTIKKDLQLLGSGGRLAIYGAAERMGYRGKMATMRLLWKSGFLSPILLMAKSRSIMGINILKLADYKPYLINGVLKEVVQLMAKGIVDPVIDSNVPIDQLASAHHRLENRETKGKVVVHW